MAGARGTPCAHAHSLAAAQPSVVGNFSSDPVQKQTLQGANSTVSRPDGAAYVAASAVPAAAAAASSLEQRVSALLARMTPAEKMGQLNAASAAALPRLGAAKEFRWG